MKLIPDIKARAQKLTKAHRRHPDWVEPFVSWAHGKGDELDFAGAWVPPRVQDLLRRANPEAAAAQDEVNKQAEQ